MDNSLNILVLSCGTRNKIIQYFKRELGEKGAVIATDCSPLAPALYEADKHYVVRRMNEKGYLDEILSICKENNIKGVLSLIDPELSFLAKHKQDFLDIGTFPIVSDHDAIELFFDKYRTFEFLNQNNLPTVKSYLNKTDFYKDLENRKINYPVFVKPVNGSASININKVTSNEELEILFNRFDNLIIQEFMDGNEYGIDVYIDFISLEPTSIFIKKKLKMRGGETDKSISVKEEKLFDLIKKFVAITNFKGIIDIDVFEVRGEYYISEVNPRFGGGYPHAYENGINVPKMIFNNLNSLVNKSEIGDYQEGKLMMKYSEIKTI
ncbi:ATP-grasp domain-containing protein [Halobacillus litoralis]|uniref:ATP-grasp domain-containing protein n=1 Tax=Halobacillus litoralis TaxID=45668 RepID=A0A845DRT6_9BACI|nr:ATP-grasp domain-containing protein [Halobacillus litoralis]MYL20106.1 ATP-grasp domain-containing protein [Halobacillus litoralis]